MRSVRTAVIAWSIVGLVGAGVAQAQRESQRGGKDRPGVSLQLATGVATDGFQRLPLDSGETLYLVPGGSFSTREVISAAGTGSDMRLTLTKAAAARLNDLMTAHGADQMAVLVNGQPAGVGVVSVDVSTASATIGGLTAVPADELTRMIGRPVVPAGPRMETLPRQIALQPGEAVTVDVYVHEVADVRGYQVDLDVAGGLTGQVTVEEVWINEQHPKYLFSGLQKLEAVDQVGGRMLGVLWDGGVTVTDGAYLGSFTLQASPDATGIFSAVVRVTDHESMLTDSAGALIPFSVTPATTISVGIPGLSTPVED